MSHKYIKEETRIIPTSVPPKFYMQHLKPYEFLKQKAAKKKVLEVGCGDGYGSYYLTDVASEVTAIDYDQDVIAKAKQKYIHPNLNFIYMDALNLSFDDSYFDIVCSFQVIEHIPEGLLINYLSGIRRVLKDGGEFYLSTLNLAHVMKSPTTYKKNPAHCKEFTADEIKQLLSHVFSKVDILGLNLTLRHRFYQRLKKLGILNFLPHQTNPVKKFYDSITTNDYKIISNNLSHASDFICICQK